MDSGALIKDRKKIEKSQFEKFKDFLNVTKEFHNFNTDDWSIQDGNNSKYMKQKDLYNCGIFVLKYIKNFLDNKEFATFNPREFRLFLKQYVLEQSEDIDLTCRKCHRPEKMDREQIHWVQCYKQDCKRWYHVKCLKMDYHTLTQSGIIFKCNICE